MQLVLYLIGGFLDNLSTLLIIFTLFGFAIRDNLKYMSFVSVLIVVPSYPLRILGLNMIDIIAHSIFFFLALRVVFQIPWMFA
ncbi:hypothetical protein DUZ99_10520 [Xylanibacillus composti]|uniref:Uncharacterized protein n=1 Tax=Xylanibacillus composti TaxID=1572762 RepID=A0A8J4M414_9BACL|nr:hypothetical protein [Xylanibacillus composti]GIQ71445.1 hypothetical protein XYCOK13_42690 [Xylanibacillus composti]